MVVDYYSSLTLSTWFLDSELSTFCDFIFKDNLPIKLCAYFNLP